MPEQYHVPTVNGIKVVNPDTLIEACQGYGWPTPFVGRANSITLPIGMEPGVAWFLLKHVDVNSLDKNGAHTLTWEHNLGSPGSAKTLNLAHYYLVSARAVTPNQTNEGAFFCEFRDRRQVLASQGGMVAKSYNVPRPRYSHSDYETNRYWPETMKASVTPTAWTWQEVLNDLWALLPSGLAGTCPTLTWNPGHAPYNLKFVGWRAWDAIAALLECCQSTLALSTTGTFSVVLLGATQEGLSWDSLITSKTFEWYAKTEIHRARAPKTIRVCLPIRGRHTGVTAPDHVWEWRTFKTYDVESGITGAADETVLPVIAPLSAELAIDGTTVLNDSEASSAATALAGKVADRIRLLGDGDWRVYRGLIDSLQPGSQVHVVRWRDYGDGEGLRTEFATDPAWAIPVSVPRVNAEHFARARLIAKTTERGAYYYGDTYPSPSSPAGGDRRIPVVFMAYTVSGSGALTWTYFDEATNGAASAIAISPPGWFPPGCEVELEHDGGSWRIVGYPTMLHGVAATDIPAAAWAAGCGTYTLGEGEAQVWFRDSPGTYVAQVFNGGGPVMIQLFNTSDEAVTAGKFLTFNLNGYGEWIVTVEPCGGICSA